MSERKERADDGEPLITRTRSVTQIGETSSLYSNIPSTAVDLLELDSDDDVEIEIYRDGFVVTKK
jgi:hypothetical protein